MKIYKTGFVCILLFVTVKCLLFGSSGQNVLETLWNQALKNNLGITEAELDCYFSKKAVDQFWKSYIPTVSLNSSASKDFEEMKTFVPENAYISAGIMGKIPGDGLLQVTPVLSVTKNILDYSQDESLTNIELVDSFKINVELSQSVRPYWIMGEKKDPEKKLLVLDKRISDAYREIEVQACLGNVTEYFILLRKYQRERLKLLKMIQYLEEKKLSVFENISRQNAKEIDLFSVEEELASYTQKLNSYENELGEVILSLCDITGICIDEINDLFDDCDVQKDNLFCELPEIEKLYEENPTSVYLKLQQEKVETEFVLNKQSAAPKISIGSTIPVHNGESKSQIGSLLNNSKKEWSFSVAVDFSGLLDSEYWKIKEKYKKYSELCEKKQIAELKTVETKHAFYEKMMRDAEVELVKATKVLENKGAICGAYENLYADGGCSFLDLQLMKTYLKMTELDVETNMDSVWFYRWMMING